MDALAFMPATELAARIRDGSFTAREVVEATIRRIEALDPQLGAFVELDAERALGAGGGPSRRATGARSPACRSRSRRTPRWPGMCMNFGSRFLAGHRPTHSAYLVRRLREAGFVIVGTTNMPEFGILPTTEPRHTGPTRNPWDLTRTPGGSSGGSAAAVAAGLVPVAHGNDGGGSLRIPAACCGLVGLKPSRGRISRGPDLGDSFLASDGVLSRTVAETALLLDVLAGYEPGDATWAPRPAEPYTLAMRRDPGRLRIAMSLDNALDVDVDPEVVHGLHSAAALLRDLGHEVVEASPALPPPEVARHLPAGVRAGDLARDRARRAARRPAAGGRRDRAALARRARARARAAVDGLPDGARAAAAAGARHGRVLRRLRPADDAGARRAAAADRRAARLRRRAARGPAPRGRFAPYTALFNVTGQPAISLPVGFGEDGLPTAVQLVGHPLGEETLLQVAAQIEAARPWAERRPLLSMPPARSRNGPPSTARAGARDEPPAAPKSPTAPRSR